MPWPMVHLAISNALAGGNPSPDLLLGCIAPDAIHARGQVSREEKGVTHLVLNGSLPAKERIMEAYLAYLPQRSEPAWKDFALGYFSHIYADLRWTETLYADFERRFEGDRDEIRRRYNEEMSQTEFDLLRSLPGAEAHLTKLAAAGGYAIAPFLTRQEVTRYREAKLGWLRNDGHEPRVRPVYFRLEAVMAFIRATSKEFSGLMSAWGTDRQLLGGESE
ncbi:hypothetical protein I8J29_30060 [Paenibacillus sp. MWE-103]|uniref:Zinc dependent phospholipase C n=1 Tax=Paenibacillus artemisiicola TaxID=1172618 RepID=A0ABS3WJE2_9BACL|nr:zinc dependent phospholipase C family protein [Paenibacillus artemisiicola]MBO7748439.1 hypothetical protein [Paenibacillus artemisiicola]